MNMTPMLTEAETAMCIFHASLYNSAKRNVSPCLFQTLRRSALTAGVQVELPVRIPGASSDAAAVRAALPP